SRLARTVIQQRHSRSLSTATQHSLNDLFGAIQRKRQLSNSLPGARPLSHVIQRVATGVVFVVRAQQSVTAFESQRPQHGVHPRRRVRHENEVGGIGAQERRQGAASLIQQSFQLTHKELNRLPLQTVANLALEVENRPRATAERAVVQKSKLWIKRP